MNPLRWVKNIAISVDILANSLLFGRKVQTISERAQQARDKGKGWGKAACAVLDAVEPDHCDDQRATPPQE